MNIHVFIKYKKEPVQYAAKCYFGYSIFHVEVMFVYCKYESAKVFFLRLTYEQSYINYTQFTLACLASRVWGPKGSIFFCLPLFYPLIANDRILISLPRE